MPNAEPTTATFEYKQFLKNLTNSPGIYQMISAEGEILYVGKAKNLKKRVSSYFRNNLSIKTAALMRQMHHIETIITHTETEALLLESSLIKAHRPRYNILLRDDKSYPYIILTQHKDYPRLDFFRGHKQGDARYFGPYPSSFAVRETLNLLQKIFRIRSCEDTFFRTRTRPCLQYQIKRCTGPCVNLIDTANYNQNVKRAILFLEGKNQAIIEEMAKKMDEASNNLDFEKAADLRDQIAHLRQIQQQQGVIGQDGDVDAVALAIEKSCVCVQVVMIRGGRVLGSKSYFPTVPDVNAVEEILAAFLAQYYLQSERIIPTTILVNHKPIDIEWISQALSEQANRKINIVYRPQEERARWLQLAVSNAKQTLSRHLSDRSTIQQRLVALQQLLNLDSPPQRIECFDISHSQGEATVASCVVFDDQGSRKSDYRRFNIENITANDDYAAMRQALTRRYARLKAEDAKLPDVLLIDGGKGQLKQAEEVLEELQVSGVTMLGVAKGPTRKAGLETLFLAGKNQPLNVKPDSFALHLIQQIRDEAHRFAITGHRGKRAKKRQTSVLEAIPGIGAKRRRELLRQFGGLQELKRASQEEIAKIPGINKELAEKVYLALQNT